MSRSPRFIVGLTGGVSSGKTFVLKCFSRWGAHTLNCDRLAHLALRKASSTYRAIVKRFGKGILSQSGDIDRAKLAAKVFSSKRKRIQLERIVHPFVFREIRRRVCNLKGIVAIEVPLLFETGFERYCDYTVAVYCKRDQQIARSCKGGALSPSEVKRRLRHQISSRERIKRSDFVINNCGTPAQTKRRAQCVWKRIKEKYKKRG